MSLNPINALRWRAVQTSRAFKEMFFNDDAKLRRAAEIALVDLREYCFARRPTFSTDSLVMARREGRRDVWLRIQDFLNLDEKQVQQLMEIDDD